MLSNLWYLIMVWLKVQTSCLRISFSPPKIRFHLWFTRDNLGLISRPRQRGPIHLFLQKWKVWPTFLSFSYFDLFHQIRNLQRRVSYRNSKRKSKWFPPRKLRRRRWRTEGEPYISHDVLLMATVRATLLPLKLGPLLFFLQLPSTRESSIAF